MGSISWYPSPLSRLSRNLNWRRRLNPVSKTFSIASVTVAFNGAEILPRHLDALKRQTHALDEIIVVNNASTDDTANLLRGSYPDITVLNLPDNGGVGGGFSAGLAYAILAKKH